MIIKNQERMLAARAGPRPEEEEEASELGRRGSFAANYFAKFSV
jgi:hypothetical protein